MGIFCEINLFKPPDGAYQPGQMVAGLIKYAVDKPMKIKKITISLKGQGDITIKERKNKDKDNRTHYKREMYVDMDNVIQDELIEVPVGSYEVKFYFNIPNDIPSTIKIRRHPLNYDIDCEIKYYVRIKFEVPGFFALNKHFKKEITVLSGEKAKLMQEPLIYGQTKKLTQLFSSKNKIVNIKATIYNSVIMNGGTINVQYEVENDSDIVVKGVRTELVQSYEFDAGTERVRCDEIVPETEAKTKSIQSGSMQKMPIEIKAPFEIYSFDNAKILARKHYARITVEIPFPHRNAMLDIPVQIGAIDEGTFEDKFSESIEEINYDDPPPSYWEAMGEEKKDDDDGVEEEYSSKKGE